jgi:N utilization substance protein B
MKGRVRGSRSRARERALQALFQVDLAAADPVEALSNAWKSEEEPPDEEAMKFSQELVRGVMERREEIDALIEKHSLNWRVERMARVDRNVMRLAVFELMHRSETPKKVVLNEAIEIAKRFGSEESGAFINGILDKIAATLPSGAPK